MLDAPALLEVVELLHLGSRQFLQFNAADTGDDVIADIVLVVEAVVLRRPHTRWQSSLLPCNCSIW